MPVIGRLAAKESALQAEEVLTSLDLFLALSLSLSPLTVEEERRQDVSSGQSCHEKKSWEKGSKQGQISDGKLPKLKVYNQGCAPLQPESAAHKHALACTSVHTYKKKNKKNSALCTSRSALSSTTKGQKCVEAQLGGGTKKEGAFLFGPKQRAL